MGDVGNNGAFARLRAQATSMRRKAESVGNKLQAIAEGIAKKYGFQKQFEKCTTALSMMGRFFPHEE